jgi:ribosomal protein S18 acetylase RimI-like enzyme
MATTPEIQRSARLDVLITRQNARRGTGFAALGVLNSMDFDEAPRESVAALIAGWDGWRGNMYRLAVREGQRRKGIRLALTRAGEEYLRGRGVGRITALVAFDDEEAGAFWEAAGYPRDREIGRRVRNL